MGIADGRRGRYRFLFPGRRVTGTAGCEPEFFSPLRCTEAQEYFPQNGNGARRYRAVEAMLAGYEQGNHESHVMLKAAKQFSLAVGKQLGLFRIVGGSRWRRQRLLILCYHGISRDEEHLWKPALYMQRPVFAARMELLKRGGYAVLPLTEAIQRMYSDDLPERSVAITFDDGGFDFYSEAYPILRSYGFPATVYLTTYYSDHQFPVFHLICWYMLWKRRGGAVALRNVTGSSEVVDLTSGNSCKEVVNMLIAFAEKEKLSAEQKNELARKLAHALDLDFDRFLEARLLQLMNPVEVAELANQGVDFQLHTHRHRSPLDKALYQKELSDNRSSIERATGSAPHHFCYPSGRHRREFLPWLREAGVVSATTCDPGLASSTSDPLLLPRLVDVESLSAIEFQGWLTGASSLLPRRQRHRARGDR
jgi:peptidoglycan/xylan/chitin deacetylase (PgdA/CDA1 family)